MLNLTKKAAQRFRVNWPSLSGQSGDVWVIDVVMVGRIPKLLIVHSRTLFTLVRGKSTLKTLEMVRSEILDSCPWYRFTGPITVGRNTDRRLTGSMTELKQMSKWLYAVDEIDRLEEQINKCLFSYLGEKPRNYGTPIEAVKAYRFHHGK